MPDNQTDNQLEKQKFASQANPEILGLIKSIAKEEGRELQSVLDEAMRDFIAKKKEEKPRRQVLSLLDESIGEFDYLYSKLAE